MNNHLENPRNWREAYERQQETMKNKQNQLNQIQQILETMTMTRQHGVDGATNSESDHDVEDIPPRRSWPNQCQTNTTCWDQGIKIDDSEFEGRLEPKEFLDWIDKLE